MALVKVRNISVNYGGTAALRDASLDINAGDFIGIIGPNGGGKSSFVKAILGLVPLSGGSVEKFESVSIGYMPQHRTLDTKFPVSVTDVILSGVHRKSLLSRVNTSDREYMNELLKFCNLEQLAHRQIAELSGGELQRVLLCRSIISRPNLLILDEPTTYVDTNFEHSFFDLLKQLNERMAIVMVSHDLGTICTHIKSVACINRTLHYHPKAEITPKILEHYECPLQIITHGKIAHTVLTNHNS